MLSCFQINTTTLLHITCPLVAIGMISRRVECIMYRVAITIWRCSPISFKHLSLWCVVLWSSLHHIPMEYTGMIKTMSHLRSICLTHNILMNFVTKKVEWREGIIILQANISSIQHQTLTCYRFVIDSSQMTLSRLIWVSKANFIVKSTKSCNLRVAYYFKAFMLDDWEVRSYSISSSLQA